jgi:predicted metal-dependent peptidase
MAKTMAYKAVERARLQLLFKDAFFATLALNLKVVETLEQPTMAVDGKHLFFNPDFVLEISEEELLGVNVHEVLHCALNHMTRRGNRDPYKSNIAMDFAVNLIVIEAGYKLPGNPATLSEVLNQQISDAYLYDLQFKGMSWEEIYERIPDRLVEKLKASDFGEGCGKVLDAAPAHDKVKLDEVAAEWEANVKMAVGAARAKGDLPGHLKSLAQHVAKPKISWRELTRQWIDQSLVKDYSWQRPNRRHLARGLILPGFISDALQHLVMLIDVSGSIGRRMQEAMLGEVSGALDEGTADKLTVIYTDTIVQHVDEYYMGDVVKLTEMHQGGGTDFRAAFKWLRDHVPDASAVVFLTDMETMSWGEDPGCPVLWGAYGSEQYVSNYKPPFGEVICVNAA